ncbi:hypothetical protein TorRG33x02_211400 [Trema orientale]|uniref:Uncharacterized protein n=1 Tax=Trema orientale TaxID=63057 RepID=A0A2P5EBV6_TREOI|nr:hypothetical protein TorRG33x02_211400 [Trema orientale]
MINVCGGPLPNLKVPKTLTKDFITGTYQRGGTSIPTSKMTEGIPSFHTSQTTPRHRSVTLTFLEAKDERGRSRSTRQRRLGLPRVNPISERLCLSWGPRAREQRLHQHVAPRRLPVTPVPRGQWGNGNKAQKVRNSANGALYGGDCDSRWC